MRTLVTRGLVEEAGHDASHRRHLYRTSGYFLERIGVTSPRRAARAGAVPARHGRPRRRAGRRRAEDAVRATSDEPWPPTATSEADDDGLVRLQKLLAQSGVASRRSCEELMLAGAGRGRRRGGHPARHQGRPAHRRDPGRRQAAAAGQRARLPGAQQAARRGLHDVRPGGPAQPGRPGRRPARAAVPRRPARHRHRRA